MIKVLTNDLFWQLVETIYGEQRADMEAANDPEYPTPPNWTALNDTERQAFAAQVLFALRLFQRFNEVPERFIDHPLINRAFAISQRFTGQAWNTAMPIPITVENAALRDEATAQMAAFDEAERLQREQAQAEADAAEIAAAAELAAENARQQTLNAASVPPGMLTPGTAPMPATVSAADRDLLQRNLAPEVILADQEQLQTVVPPREATPRRASK